MSWETVLVVFVFGAHIVLAVLVLVSLLRKVGAEPELDTNGRKILRPSRVLLWTGILLAIWSGLGLYMTVKALASEQVMTSGVLVGLMVMLTAGLMGIWILARYFSFRITWDEDTLEVTDWRRNHRQYRWSDLKELAERRGTENIYGLVEPGQTEVRVFDLELRFENGGLVRTAPNLVGYYAFLSDAGRHWKTIQRRSS